MGNAAVRCFHCGEPVPPDSPFQLEHDGHSLPMCCAGCLAVSRLIHDAGLNRYYDFRQSLARKAGDDLEKAQLAWRACDAKPALWGEAVGEDERELMLQTEGIQCAACAWLIQSQLTRRRGIEQVQVDPASGYTTVNWKPSETSLSDIAMALYALGYKPHLPLAGAQERARQEERKQSLKRLGVAGLGMMQVMMYAVGLYAGEALGIDARAEQFLQWVSLVVTTPVLLYSGRLFYQGAWREIKARRPGMDVPVALAISIAYGASLWGFFSGTGDVWFDSVVMFIFFLLVGRHVEMVLRHRNQQSGAVLARLLPEWVERLTEQGSETVLASDLAAGDRVLVRPGEAFPADGRVLAGESEVNEALLTGESFPRSKREGSDVIAGSINLMQPLEMEVTRAGVETTVSALGRLLEKARAKRSSVNLLIERIASKFVVGVLLVAAASCAWWLSHEPGLAMQVTLAVLVVSCPCALSLAAPAAVAAGSRALLKQGVILTRGEALEALSVVDTVLFDKTGTLTSGAPRIAAVTLNPERNDCDEQKARHIAARLESVSAHPLAQAFRLATPVQPPQLFETVTGEGVSGTIDGAEYRIGRARFAGVSTNVSATEDGTLWLSDRNGWIARFELSDRLRSGATVLIDKFKATDIEPRILSGDAEANVRSVARELGITEWQSGLQPAGKLAALEHLKAQGRHLLMVGDGVNDAPVLAAADVSMAVQGGSELANSAADLILTGRSLGLVWTARQLAVQTRRIIKQNMFWAVSYNITMIPLAVTGWLQPWMAAIGMSASSLLVVLNAARLGYVGDSDDNKPADVGGNQVT
jgi:Cu2+-exporting ATPase